MMAEKDPPKPPSQSSRYDPELWQAATRDVTPLPPSPVQGRKAISVNPYMRMAQVIAQPTFAGATSLSQNIGMDRRTEQRFRQGKMQIEARLDLHGLTLSLAHVETERFIRRSYAAGKRCLLIITGKGQDQSIDDKLWYEPGRGQIRKALPDWLAGPEIAAMILSTSRAKGNHGGAGAVYVLLRRHRS